MRARGFTLVEMAVVVAIAAVLAAAAIPIMRAARRNASVQSAAFELRIRLEGLRARAMRDQGELVAVVVDVPDNDPEPCATGTGAACGRYYLLRPQPGFVLNAFDPDLPPIANAELLEVEELGKGLKFYRPDVERRPAPRPFEAISAFDPELVGVCGRRSCVGIRFRGDGEVSPEYPTGVAGAAKLGVSFVLGSDVDAETPGSDQRGLVVTFPAGLVRAYSLSR
jgi:prepilin-type N-terminal cleavage/methylation domain-containing protein